jgi:alkaline phosphatase D
MNSMGLDFFVHTGDNVYYDQPKPYATSVPLARFKWNRMSALPFQRSFLNDTSSYFIKDDHDTLKNDSWPGQNFRDLTWSQGLALFREQVPMGEKTYRTFRWGKHLQIWLVEGRDFRSPNTAPDGPDKTIWGAAQKNWFFETVQNSDATYRILISPTPIVGPDRDDKSDNHANPSFRTEGKEIRSFIGSQKNMFVICGDRHWQYVSQDPETGVIEFCSGPTTEKLATGFEQSDRSPMHKFLNVRGGFLSVEVSQDEEDPEIIFTHHAVDGSIYNQESFRP